MFTQKDYSSSSSDRQDRKCDQTTGLKNQDEGGCNPVKSLGNIEHNAEKRENQASATRRGKRFNPRHWRHFPNDRNNPVNPTQEHGSRTSTAHGSPQGAPATRGESQPYPTAESVVDRLKKPGPKYPEFDSLAEHSVPPITARTIRLAEAERLLAIVKSPGTPLALGQTKLIYGMQGDQEGYRKLSRLSHGILTAQNLCLLDNECINVGFCSRLASRGRMEKLVKQAQLAADMKTLGDGEGGQNNEYLSDVFIHDMFQLVDYVSAILIRLSSQTAVGDYWISNIMAALVARVAKIKVILMNIVMSASESATAGAECLEKSHGVSGKSSNFSFSIGDDEEECEEALRIIDANTKEGLTSEEDAEISAYCVAQNKFRSGINAALKYILASLRLANRSGLPATNYEMCAVAYDIGFEGFKTVLFQDRDIEYSASSDRNTLNTAQSAFSILNQTLVDLQVRNHNTGQESTVPTYVEWAFLESNTNLSASAGAGGIDHNRLSRSRRKFQVHTLVDIVEVMVPLIATSPISLTNFTSFRTMMSLTGGVEDVVSPFEEGQFGAFFRLYTSEFEEKARDQEILRLSTAFKEQRFSRCKMFAERYKGWKRSNGELQRVSTEQLAHQPIDQPDDEVQMQRKLDECAIKMKQWVVDETSVTVSCRKYVSTVMATVLVIVAGGLAMGLSVGDRIPGVDPFNLATYTWALAAFVILVAKSLLVEDWAWRDFLRQRVRCRSVSELAAAAHLDEQLIIAKLLHDDCNGTTLSTRGPFNSVFRRQASDSQGFSIDRPISAETLMLSCLALLEVVTPRGHSIVCLDYRCGTFLTVLQHQMGTEDGHLVCEDLSRIPRGRKNGDSKDGQLIRLRLVKQKNFKWKRVLGLYEFKRVGVVFE